MSVTLRAMNARTNRRQHKRRRVGIPGLVKTLHGQTVVCRVHDVSHAGARITSAFAELPRSFTLFVSKDQRIFRECHVVWQRGLEFGVAFKDRDTIALAAL